jgi:hypothetical protein
MASEFEALHDHYPFRVDKTLQPLLLSCSKRIDSTSVFLCGFEILTTACLIQKLLDGAFRQLNSIEWGLNECLVKKPGPRASAA